MRSGGLSGNHFRNWQRYSENALEATLLQQQQAARADIELTRCRLYVEVSSTVARKDQQFEAERQREDRPLRKTEWISQPRITLPHFMIGYT